MAAVDNRTCSRLRLAISCTPSGSPSPENPDGSARAGNPARLTGLVRTDTAPPWIPMVSPSCMVTRSTVIGGAGNGVAGASSRSTPLRRSANQPAISWARARAARRRSLGSSSPYWRNDAVRSSSSSRRPSKWPCVAANCDHA